MFESSALQRLLYQARSRAGGLHWVFGVSLAIMTLAMPGASQAQRGCNSFPAIAMTPTPSAANLQQVWGGVTYQGRHTGSISLFGPIQPDTGGMTSDWHRFAAVISDPDSIGSATRVVVSLRARAGSGPPRDLSVLDSDDPLVTGVALHEAATPFHYRFRPEAEFYWVQVTLTRRDSLVPPPAILGYRICPTVQ
jgi:hypothetical protein